MGDLLGQRAIVVGAGIGGLSAAAVLARYFRHVDVLDRDRLPSAPKSRAGTPQDRHSHGLLAGGLKALDEICPGFEHDLEAAGAVRVKVAQEVRYERADVGALPLRDLDQSLLCASRPLIEHVLRSRVGTMTNVTLRAQCRVTDIRTPMGDAGAPAVHFETAAGRSEWRDADFVVDASGRGALTLASLDVLGWDRPVVTEIGVDISYATVVVQIPPNAPSDWKLLITLPDPPAHARHGVLLPMEGNRWSVTIADHGGTKRLENWDDFVEGLRRMPTPTMYQALRYAEPPDCVRSFGFPESVWRHFERLPRLPYGILPMADALCRFNPIHGQGMSSAAKQARLLWDVLARSATEADPIAAAQAGFLAEVASVLQTPWNMSGNADFAFPATRGEKPEHFEEGRRFEADLFRAVVADPVVHRATMAVAQLLAPDSVFQEPDIQRRIEAVSAARLDAAAQ
jgi:2-polyprenyl-6-methoxyphenol hydroxylase-like FAD-dependent oxidoreductase